MSNQKPETAEGRARAFMGKEPTPEPVVQSGGPSAMRSVTVREEVLSHALQLVTDDRNKLYGPPAESFEKIAIILSILMGKTVTREDVALFNIAQKLVRNSYAVKGDNSVDLVGYGAILREIEVSPKSPLYAAVMEIIGRKE